MRMHLFAASACLITVPAAPVDARALQSPHAAFVELSAEILGNAGVTWFDLVMLAISPIPARADELGSLRTFGDWVIGCDNGRACHALSLAPADAPMEGWLLRLERGGAANAPASLALIPQTENYPRSGLLRIRAGSTEIATLVLDHGVRVEDDELLILDRAATAAIVAAMMRADAMEFLFEQQPAGSDVPVTMSLNGARAALLRMDDLQHRFDTVTALVRRGPKPAEAVPMQPALPIVAREHKTAGGPPPEALPAATRAEMIRQSADYCDDPDRERLDSDGRNIVRLGPGLVLASVPCFSGAYNFGRAYFLVEEGRTPRVRPARFPRPVEQKDEPGRELIPDNVLWNADFAANSNEISQFSKGRGYGDCGETGDWRWDGQTFQAVSITRMNSCRGVPTSVWPQIFSSRDRGS